MMELSTFYMLYARCASFACSLIDSLNLDPDGRVKEKIHEEYLRFVQLEEENQIEKEKVVENTLPPPPITGLKLSLKQDLFEEPEQLNAAKWNGIPYNPHSKYGSGEKLGEKEESKHVIATGFPKASNGIQKKEIEPEINISNNFSEDSKEVEESCIVKKLSALEMSFPGSRHQAVDKVNSKKDL